MSHEKPKVSVHKSSTIKKLKKSKKKEKKRKEKEKEGKTKERARAQFEELNLIAYIFWIARWYLHTKRISAGFQCFKFVSF